MDGDFIQDTRTDIAEREHPDERTDVPRASEDADTVITVKGMSKAYRIVQPQLLKKGKISLKDHTDYPIFENIDLEVKRGDILAIIGRNGCGKSTFLKIVSGIIEPDRGTVEVKGKIASILELSM